MVHICQCHHVRGMIYRFVTKFQKYSIHYPIDTFQYFLKDVLNVLDKFTSLVLSVKSVWLLRPCLIRPEPDPDFRSESYNSAVTEGNHIRLLADHKYLSVCGRDFGDLHRKTKNILIHFPHHRPLLLGIHRLLMDSHQKEPVMQQFCFFDVSLEKHYNKQSIGQWNEKPKRSCDIIHNTE